jgi:phage terminase large subunit-like protein
VPISSNCKIFFLGCDNRLSKIKIVLPGLHEYQQQMADDPTRFKYLSCGRRWGKSKGCAVIAVKAAMSGQKGWWVAPVYKTAAIGWRDISTLANQIREVCIQNDWPAPYIQEGAMTATFPGGGSITCRSSEIPDNLRGEGLDFVIMDEADFQEERVWTAILRPMLTDRKGWAIFISTPNIEGGWFHQNYMKGMPGNPPDVPYLNPPYGDRKDYKSWQLSSYTNPFIEDSEIDDAKTDIPFIVFRREYLGEFVSAAGARIQRDWLKGRYFKETPAYLKVVVGVDLAISEKDSADWNACVAIGRSVVDGQVYVLDADHWRGTFHETANKIAAFAQSNGVDKIAVENNAAQQWMVQELSLTTNLTVVGVHSDRDIFSRFAPLESRYEQRQVWHREGLPRAFEAELFSFGSDNLEHDDFESAMGTAARILFKKEPRNLMPTRVVTGGKGYKGA